MFNLKVAKSPSRLKFTATLSRERSQLHRAQSRPDESGKCREDSLCGKCLIKKCVLRFFLKDKYVGAERTVFKKWFQRNGAV